jgi:hypothetical protein
VVREWEARIYDDDSLCGPTASLSRYQRCGSNRDIGSSAQTAAIVAFAGAGVVGVATGILLVAGTGRSDPPAAARLTCGITGAGLDCSARF